MESIFKVRSCFIDNNITPSTTTKEEEEEDIAEEQLVLHETILTFFENEFVKPYYDVQYFVYKGIHSIVLNLIAGLERIAKKKKKNSSKKKDDEGEEEEEDSSDDVDDALVLQARAERNAGLIAENICRLLLMMEYVPTSSTTSELEDGASGRFLFVPAVLSTKDNVDEEEYDEKKKNDQVSIQLNCKHIFHPECIKGWLIVGKKDTCPSCQEKVDLRQVCSDKPWETRNLSWIQMLDMVRYMIVWQPTIMTGLHLIFHVLKWDKDFEQENSDMSAQGNTTTM